MEKTKITIIGAGVIGLAIAYELSKLVTDIIVVDKNDSFGRETSSRNSEVIHTGLYYLPGSLKAKTCIEGNKLLYEFCAQNNIPHKKLGKLVSACNDEEAGKIEAIYENAAKCGVEGLKFMGESEIKKIEPNIKVRRAIFSPEAGIIDSHQLMDFFFKSSKQAGAVFSFSTEVVGIERKGSGYEIFVKDADAEKFSFESEVVINSAGLNSDKVAAIAGISEPNYKIHYCKGQYFRVTNPGKFSINHLVYPPPTNIDLGIHLTPDLAGGLRLGPDAEYISEINYDVSEKDKLKFFDSARKFLPNLEEDDLIPDTAGVRPKLQKPEESFRDFVIQEESKKGFPAFVNLIGIESPGLTACLAIARKVKEWL